MDFFNSIEVLAALALGLAISMIVLLVMQVRSSNQISKLTYPAYEYTIKKAQNTADEIIAEAREQARGIIASAESESERVLESHAADGEKAFEAYLRSLEALKTSLGESLTKSAEETRTESAKLAQVFEEHLKAQEDDMRTKLSALGEKFSAVPEHLEAEASAASEELRARTKQAGDELEKALVSIQGESREQINDYLQKQFAEAEADIEAYRQSRRELINKHIEVLVLDVVRLVLQKELSKDDHAHLVREALEEARTTGVL